MILIGIVCKYLNYARCIDKVRLAGSLRDMLTTSSSTYSHLQRSFSRSPSSSERSVTQLFRRTMTVVWLFRIRKENSWISFVTEKCFSMSGPRWRCVYTRAGVATALRLPFIMAHKSSQTSTRRRRCRSWLNWRFCGWFQSSVHKSTSLGRAAPGT